MVGAKISEYIWSRISLGKSRKGIGILESLWEGRRRGWVVVCSERCLMGSVN